MHTTPAPVPLPPTSASIADRPALSPACPRDSVIPPAKSNFPSALYNTTCPLVAAPNRRASTPSSSLTTSTPGISAALFHKSVFSHPIGSPAGRTTNTTALSFPPQSVINFANSPTVAREHGHFGCANITSVGNPSTLPTRTPAGHESPARAATFGVLSYAHSRDHPNATPNAQAVPIIT